MGRKGGESKENADKIRKNRYIRHEEKIRALQKKPTSPAGNLYQQNLLNGLSRNEVLKKFGAPTYFCLHQWILGKTH